MDAKRYKYSDKNEISHNQPDKCFLFENLPLEIRHKIFYYLNQKTILNIRQVNKNLKQIVDVYGKMWQKIVLSPNFGRREKSNKHNCLIPNDLDSIEYLLRLVSSVEFEYMSADPVPEKLFQTNNNLSIRVKLINTESIAFLNLFSSSCKMLEIDSFCMSREQMQTVFTSNVHEFKFVDSKTLKSQKLNLFDRLKSLTIDCKLYWEYENFRESKFKWQNIYSNNCLFNQMESFSPHLTHLHLRNYNDSFHLLFSSLHNLKNLKLVEFDNCWTSFLVERRESYQTNENQCIDLETLVFNEMNFESIEECLDACNLEILNNLAIFNLQDSDEDELETFFNKLTLNKLKSLKCFCTNLFLCLSYEFDDSVDVTLVRKFIFAMELLVLCDQLNDISLKENRFLLTDDRLNKKQAYYFSLDDFKKLFFDENNDYQPIHIIQLLIVFCENRCQDKIDNILESLTSFKLKAKYLKFVEIKFKCHDVRRMHVCSNFKFLLSQLKSSTHDNLLNKYEVNKNTVKIYFS